MDSFVQDVRAALPTLAEDTRLAQMTPPDTPPRYSPVAESKHRSEPAVWNGVPSHALPQSETANTHHSEHGQASRKEAVPTDPFPSTEPSSHAGPKSPLRIAHQHSLTLQIGALHDSLELYDTSYDILLEENTILRRRVSFHMTCSKEKDVEVCRLQKLSARLRRQVLELERDVEVLNEKVREGESGVKDEHEGGGEGKEGEEAVKGVVKGEGQQGEQEEQEKRGMKTVKQSANVDIELSPNADSNKHEHQETADARAQFLGIPVLTSILLDILAVGLVQGIVCLWQWRQSRGM